MCTRYFMRHQRAPHVSLLGNSLYRVGGHKRSASECAGLCMESLSQLLSCAVFIQK